MIPIAKLRALPLATLEELSRATITVLKEKRRDVAWQRGNELQVGQTVSIYSTKKGRTITGTIEKINLTKCVLREIDPKSGLPIRWTVPMNMIPATDKPAAPAGSLSF